MRQAALSIAANCKIEMDCAFTRKLGCSLSERSFSASMIARTYADKYLHHICIEVIGVFGNQLLRLGRCFVQIGSERALYFAPSLVDYLAQVVIAGRMKRAALTLRAFLQHEVVLHQLKATHAHQRQLVVLVPLQYGMGTGLQFSGLGGRH